MRGDTVPRRRHSECTAVLYCGPRTLTCSSECLHSTLRRCHSKISLYQAYLCAELYSSPSGAEKDCTVSRVTITTDCQHSAMPQRHPINNATTTTRLDQAQDRAITPASGETVCYVREFANALPRRRYRVASRSYMGNAPVKRFCCVNRHAVQPCRCQLCTQAVHGADVHSLVHV